jgi:phosphoribosyl-ATP pyrophosphohydrolase
MLVPSIDLMGGQAVSLIGGQQKAIADEDPRAALRRFALAGEVTIVDVDAALGRGDHKALLRELVRGARCRVGGGIRTEDDAIGWLDAGAAKIIVGTAATPELLERLPRERVVVALDAHDGEVMVDGWRRPTGARVEDRMRALAPLAGGFLVTFIERAGRLKGIDLARVEALVRAAGDVRVTFAGGVTSAEEIAAIDRLGADAQVGLALASGALDLADAITAPLTSDRADGAFPTVICDEHQRALGFGYSTPETLRAALRTRRPVVRARPGEVLESPGELVEVALDCHRESLRFATKQGQSGFCHQAPYSCWGEDNGLPRLARTLAERRQSAPAGSYSKRLFDDAALLEAKLLEEAGELAAARTPDHVAAETADVVYFALVAAARAGVSLADVEAHIDRRSLRVTRRKGDAKVPLERKPSP